MDIRIEDKIRLRAYEIWEFHQWLGLYLIFDNFHVLRNRTPQDDWLDAEREIRNQEGICR